MTNAPGANPPAVCEVMETTCVIVGGGPGGAMLALLLARQRVPVILLEAHSDFDREFRGDTLHPSSLEALDQLGLADRLLALPHAKMRSVSAVVGGRPAGFGDFGRLHTRFPYIAMIPQARFLEYLTAEAARSPFFRLIMNANVQELIEEGGAVRGVRFRGRDGLHEVRAALTVGADGRFSRVRHLSGLTPIATSPPLDILWFRLPRLASDPDQTMGRVGRGRILVMLDRDEDWQLGYAIPKGSYQRLRAGGLEALRRGVAELAPELGDRTGLLQDWKQVSLLSVESSRLPRWRRPGLLLIGDAAHVMSPVGGVGINYAVQDAIAAGNLLGKPLREGTLTEADLAAVQRRREWPTRFIQAVQALVQSQLLAAALDASRPFEVPAALRLLLRLPLLRDLPVRLIAYGVRPERVRYRQ